MYVCMYVYAHMTSYTNQRQLCMSRRHTGHVSTQGGTQVMSALFSIACALRCVYIHTYIHECVCIYKHDELYKQETALFIKIVPRYTHTCICVHTFIHIHTHTYTYIHTRNSLVDKDCAKVHTYMHMHPYIHTYTYTYIHLHTYKKQPC